MKSLALAAFVGLFSFGVSQDASATSNLLRSIFKYECKAADQFQCVIEVSDGEPYLKIKFDEFPGGQTEAGYKSNLLIARFISAGGRFIELHENSTGKYRTCSRIKGKLDIFCEQVK